MKKNGKKMTTRLSTAKKGALDYWAGRKSLNWSGFTSGVKARRAFTLIELLVVIAIIAILAAILLPVLSRAKQTALKAQCISNFKQLQLCYRMYIDDNNDCLPENFLSGGVSNSWVVGDAQTDYNTFNIRHASIYPYNQNPKIYVCPAANYSIPVSTFGAYDDFGRALKLNQLVPLTRTCSVEYSMGGNSFNSASGPWYVSSTVTFNTYQKLSSIQATRLATKIAFVDESIGTVDDGVFAMWPMNSGQNYWWNLPTSHHDNGAVFGFADCHVEYHKWHGTAVIASIYNSPTMPQPRPGLSSTTIAADSSPDLPWVQAGGPQYP